MIETMNRETGYARINGANLHYTVAGQGHPLVLIHAGIADSRMWNKQIDEFARRFLVITYDLRGFGRTAMPSGLFSHYRDLAGLLEYLAITRACLLGSSMGGAVAINCALEHGEYIDGLILVDSAIDGYVIKDNGTREDWAAVDRALENGNFDLAADLEIKMWLAGMYRSVDQMDPENIKLMRDMLLPTYSIPGRRGTEQPLEPPAIDRLGDIRVPTLIVTGDHDLPDFHKMSDLLARNIPASQKRLIWDAAHLPSLEHPDQFNKIVLDFLEHCSH